MRPALQVVLQADALDLLLLGSQPVDTFFVFVFLFFQKLAADIVLLLFAHGNGFYQCGVFFALLAKSQLMISSVFSPISSLPKLLQIGQAFQQQDAFDDFVGGFHFYDGLLVEIFAQIFEPQFFRMRACRKYC